MKIDVVRIASHTGMYVHTKEKMLFYTRIKYILMIGLNLFNRETQ